MSYDKAIEYQKAYRKPYYGAKAIDKTCRNHGSCDYCKNNRLYHNNKRELSMIQKEKSNDYERERG